MAILAGVFTFVAAAAGQDQARIAVREGVARNPNRLAGIARELRDQLVVTYARPQSVKAVQKIDVAIKRRGIKLRAPKHVS